MKERKRDELITKTPQEEIEICEHCPYPRPICGDDGCGHFKMIKAALLKARRKRKD